MARGGKVIPTGGTAQRIIQSQRIRGVQSIPLDKLIPYHREIVNGSPIFRDYSEEKLNQLADSLERDGQIENIIVFPSESRSESFEVLSGKQRTMAAKIVVKRHPERNTLNAVVLDLAQVKANDWALGDLTYVLTNTQRRDKLFVSELALAYEMQFQAIKHQGKTVSAGKDTLTEIAKLNQTSPSFIKCVRQFIPQIAIPEIIALADADCIPMSAASQTLTRMNKATQRSIIDVMEQAGRQNGYTMPHICKMKLTTAVLRQLKAAYDVKLAQTEDSESCILTADDLAFLSEGTAKPAQVEFRAPSKKTLQKVIPEMLWNDRKGAEKYLIEAMDELRRYKEKYGELQ